jgi:hypothetical protein
MLWKRAAEEQAYFATGSEANPTNGTIAMRVLELRRSLAPTDILWSFAVPQLSRKVSRSASGALRSVALSINPVGAGISQHKVHPRRVWLHDKAGSSKASTTISTNISTLWIQLSAVVNHHSASLEYVVHSVPIYVSLWRKGSCAGWSGLHVQACMLKCVLARSDARHSLCARFRKA